jgi:S1-C subfamily serine protease
VPAPPPRPALALRGVAEIAGKQVAVLTDTTTGIDLFLLRGEAHGEWVLQTLDAGGVTLQTLDRQQTARLDLPAAVEPRVVAGPSAAAPAANREPAPAGLPAAAHLGVSLTQLTVADAAARFGEGSGTLLVTGVSRPDSLLQAGDLICELGGIQVAATEEVMAVLRALHPGAEVTLRVQRQRETVTVTLKLL